MISSHSTSVNYDKKQNNYNNNSNSNINFNTNSNSGRNISENLNNLEVPVFIHKQERSIDNYVSNISSVINPLPEVISNKVCKF